MNKDLRPEEMASLFVFFFLPVSVQVTMQSVKDTSKKKTNFSFLEFLNSSKRFYRAGKASVY